MKIGIATVLTDASVDVAHKAEELGFESIWLAEHTAVPADATSSRLGGGDIPEHLPRIVDPLSLWPGLQQ